MANSANSQHSHYVEKLFMLLTRNILHYTNQNLDNLL